MDPIIGIIIFALILIAGIVTYFIDAVHDIGSIVLGFFSVVALLFYMVASGNIIFGSIIFGLMIIGGIATYFTDKVDNWVSAVIGLIGLIFLIILLFF